MELVYLWVEDYKNIHKQEFNFSPRFNCKYDEDNNKLTIDENEVYIDNFFGDNINVTAIVGKNGSGKSSVLSYIEQLIFLVQNRNFNIENKSVIIYYYDKKLFWIKSDDFNPNMHNQNKIYDLDQDIDHDIDYFSYYSEMPYDSFSYFHEELSGDFLMTPKKFNQMKKEHYVDLSYEHIGELLLDTKLNLKAKIPKIFKPTKILVKNNVKFTSVVRDDIEHYISTSIDPNEFNNDLLYMMEDVLKFEFNSYEICLLENLISRCKESDISDYIYRLNDVGNYSASIKTIFENLHEFLRYNKYIYQSDYISTFPLDLYYEKLDHTFYFSDISFEDNLSNRQGLFLFDFEDDKGRKYSSLSYGEKILFGQMLNYHYRLHSLNNGLFGFITNEIFLIDEPDISLHPMWQKQYIELLIEACKSYPDKKIHILLTTHSPFLLSDIPKQNIVFLDTDEEGNCKVVDGLKDKKQTFGANIHTLLSDSFFMKDGLMGEFAKSKINEIIEFHKEVENEDNDKSTLKTEYLKNQKMFWQTQSIVGEPYLKQILENHLIEIEKILLGKDGAKEGKKERLKAQLKELGDD